MEGGGREEGVNGGFERIATSAGVEGVFPIPIFIPIFGGSSKSLEETLSLDFLFFFLYLSLSFLFFLVNLRILELHLIIWFWRSYKGLRVKG